MDINVSNVIGGVWQLAVGGWLFQLACLTSWNVRLFLLAFKLAEKASCLWSCLVNFSIGCWLFIREKVSQQAKSQPKELAFPFWLKSQLFTCFKSHLPNTFFGCLTNQQAKSQNPTKKLSQKPFTKHPLNRTNIESLQDGSEDYFLTVGTNLILANPSYSHL